MIKLNLVLTRLAHKLCIHGAYHAARFDISKRLPVATSQGMPMCNVALKYSTQSDLLCTSHIWLSAF